MDQSDHSAAPPALTVITQPHIQRGTGAPLVVLPGLSGRHGSPAQVRRWFQRQEIAELSNKRAVLSIDRRAGLEPGISIVDLAAEYAVTLDSLFDLPVDIVGISTGGSIALQLAADYPHLVRRLVLVSSAHRLSDHGRNTQRTVAALLRSGRSRSAAAVFLANTGSTRLGHALLAFAGLLAPRTVLGRRDHDLLVTLDAEETFDLGDRLETMTTPTLIIGGARDRFYSAAIFTHASQRMPHASLVIRPRAGHLGTHGNPRLAREILQFLGVPLDHDSVHDRTG